jgi:ABC-type Na+ efflux pump permease subunit
MALLALARMTISDGIRQPLTWLAVGLSIGLIALSFLFGMFNFETQDRVRMLCTAGVAVAVLNGLFLGVVLASTAIHDELASRTALTLFAKPLSRGSYLAGKALGVWTVVACASLVIALAHGASLLLALWTQFESSDDGHHHGFTDDLWVPWARMVGAHLLALAHAGVTTALAAVLALRLPLVANILACFAIFVLGHLLPGLGWHGLLLIPDLAAFNVDDSLQLVSQPLTVGYCLLTFLYALLCCTGCGLLGLAVFARQDIP